MCKLALSFSLIIVGVLLVGSIVSSFLRYRKKDDSVKNSVKNTAKNTAKNSSNTMSNFARLNEQTSSNNLSKSLNSASFSPYVSSVDNNEFSYGFFRGGDSLSGC